jgi:hypothetical protein
MKLLVVGIGVTDMGQRLGRIDTRLMLALRGDVTTTRSSSRRVTRPAPPGVGPFFEGSGGWSW